MNDARYLSAIVLEISSSSLESEIKILSKINHSFIIIDLKRIHEILPVIWFRKLRSSLALYNKTILAALNPGICLENLKSASIAIVEDSDLCSFNERTPTEEKINYSKSETIVHHGHLRGGQSVINKSGDVVIIGNLNYGAEVIAGGNIHVIGALNGRALAGTHLGKTAIISAFSLKAELISIDGYYLSSDEIKPQEGAVYIFLNENEISIRSSNMI